MVGRGHKYFLDEELVGRVVRRTALRSHDMGSLTHHLDIAVRQTMIHEHVPKFQRGLDIPWLGWHRREPFEKGDGVAVVRQSTYNGAVCISRDDMTKERRHVVKQVYDK